MSEKQPQWILCSEHMPEQGETVAMLVWYTNARRFIALGYSLRDGYWHRDGDPGWLYVPDDLVCGWYPIPLLPNPELKGDE
jgi:hypothetical protein